MWSRPDLVDNIRPQANHADALAYLLGDTELSHGLSVATGYVSLDGLSQLARLASDGRGVRLLIGAETDPDQRTALLARFCPDTVIQPGYVPPDGEVDLLLSNDVGRPASPRTQRTTVLGCRSNRSRSTSRTNS